MKMHAYLIRLSFSIMIIFGGTLAIVYIKTGDLLVYHLIATCVGVVLLLTSWMWRTRNKVKEGEMV
ncbi:hypothetical protein [Rossellomorea vietnamensis]|uniref:hypothetical protein n=1 Tax=Rossellomorea vietnamensis TaxID=218284 RepID=UPI00077C5276|nr:hypothetical protein [Rossellomorea vietnamensis]OXS64495.1 hypothetical protein B1B00_01855 [Bacillus sp. DSM 27956]PRX79647.1 hypothetical protein B0G93_101397 [Bacillus sp. V-88]SLK00713.1 hypothetical protein SAMN06295884_101397 [Bacillus sp. V-88]